MGLTVTETRGFGVRVGGGQVIHSRGKCSELLLTIQGIEIMEEFLLFELGDTDVVLGYSWLAKLGDTRTNWGLLKISWKIGSYWVTLVGDPALSRAHVSLHTMERVIKHNGEVYLLELTTLFENKKQLVMRQQFKEIKYVLEKYQKVFEMPNELPLARNREHAITLKEGSVPVSRRPYRYSF